MHLSIFNTKPRIILSILIGKSIDAHLVSTLFTFSYAKNRKLYKMRITKPLSLEYQIKFMKLKKKSYMLQIQ